MIAKIQKWGNSQGLRLNLHILESAKLKVGDEVEITESDGQIVITPAKRLRGQRNLKHLLAEVPAEYAPEEADWGARVGKEAW